MPMQDSGQITSSTLHWQNSACEVVTLRQMGLTVLINQHIQNYTLKMWVIIYITEGYNID